MLLSAFVVGVTSTLLLLFGFAHVRRVQFLRNSNPNWSKPGKIALGSFDRFETALEAVFPTSPARSYVSLFAYNDHPYQIEETVFFIRSVGKRNGGHRYMGELRLSSSDRDHAPDAIPFLDRMCGPLERTDKSYGLLILKTSKLDKLEPLVRVAQEFAARVLRSEHGEPFSINWHIAGSNVE